MRICSYPQIILFVCLFLYLVLYSLSLYYRDDIGDLDRTLEAMSLLGLSDLQVSQVLSLLSGILHLGNIEITANEGEEAALQVDKQTNKQTNKQTSCILYKSAGSLYS